MPFSRALPWHTRGSGRRKRRHQVVKWRNNSTPPLMEYLLRRRKRKRERRKSGSFGVRLWRGVGYFLLYLSGLLFVAALQLYLRGAHMLLVRGKFRPNNPHNRRPPQPEIPPPGTPRKGINPITQTSSRPISGISGIS
jgi:hypothetical protein